MSSRWIAFLRAINTGNRRVTGDRLVAIFESLGFEQVSSFQASGNVLFSADEPNSIEIEQALVAALGYEVPTVLRSGRTVQELASAMPFSPTELEASQRRVQVVLVRDPPSSSDLDTVLARTPAEDLLRPHGSDVFWLPRAGVSDSMLDLATVERNLGPVTVRTHNTILRLADRV